MSTKFLYRILFASFCLLMTGCNDDNETFFEDLTGDETIERVHPNERDKPYPREEHELYLNPVPLIVPKTARAVDESLEFELSQDASFPEQGTFHSGKLAWNMYNTHKELAVGEWYWRFRKIDRNDRVGAWSEVNKFTVTGKEPVFVTPEFSVFQQNIPTVYPRIHCFLDEDIKKVSPIDNSHREYRELIARTNSAMNHVFTTANPYDDASTLDIYVFDYLYTAYLLTKEQKYHDKMLEFGRKLIAYNVQDKQLFAENFYSASVIKILSTIYDACQESLDGSEKLAIENVMTRILVHYYNSYRGTQENHIFDNHTWQIVLRALTQGAFVYCEKSEEAMNALEYFYELWTARAPASGFNRDGAWINGTGYFNTNAYTLYYMPMLLSHLTGTDFLKHPWYQNVGKSLVYSWLPGTATTGFGDIGGPELTPHRVRVAFADFAAREIGDSYAAWYVNECGNTIYNDYGLRLYRIARGHITYSGPELNEADMDNFVWYQDIGEGVAFSDMTERSSNMSLSFRSSPFGSGSHTLADQNSFKLLYKGVYVYMNAGYYQNFSDKHNLLQYRHTRGHNTMLVNGIGQPYTTKAYGNVERGLNSENLAYFLGNASNAYCGISEYPLWLSAFEAAGITQTPVYGFGNTPLNNYKRHIFMLRPNIVVIYDDLGADEAVTWQWLLHSPVEFHIAGNKVTTTYPDKGGFTSVAQIFSEQAPTIETTNQWFPGGEPTVNPTVDKQWHLTANFGPSMRNKILTIIQVGDDNRMEDIWQVNNSFTMGDWSLKAELAADRPAAISITNEVTGTAFSYGHQAPTINGVPYQRQQENSSVLYDYVRGAMQVQESADKPVQTTRAVR